MQCLDENALLDFFDHKLSPEVCAQIDLHIDGCPACRALVATLALASPVAAAEEDTAHEGESVDGGLAAGAILAETYRLERVVGEGGMGIVWAATHLGSGRAVALKVLKAEETEAKRRFLREARVSTALVHANVIDVQEVFALPDDGPLVMVMDLLEGESLDRHLERRGRLPLGEVVAILAPLVDAVAAAHALGIVHRDLKPQNVFLAKRGGQPFVKLLDFGIAKLTADAGDAARTGGLTRSGTVMGTPHYMAPEQLYGETEIDARADVWSIGVITYECLSGQRPVEGRSFGQIFRNLTSREIVPLATLVTDVPAPLAELVSRMLARKKEDRAALGELADWLAGERA